jgi:hypothetical protein
MIRNGSERSRKFSQVVSILMIAGFATLAQAGEIRNSDSRARAIMKKSAEYLSSLERYRFEADLTTDMFEGAEMIEVGGSRHFSVKRPHRIRVEMRDRDAIDRILIANPKIVLLINRTQNTHFEIPSPGSLDDVIDTFIEQLDGRPPLAQLIYSNLWRVLDIRIESARYLGEAEIDETMCDHLAFRNLDADWQVWVEQGDRPVIRRFVIRHKSRLGHPTVRAELEDWETEADLPDSLFDAEVPKGSRNVKLSEIQGRR